MKTVWWLEIGPLKESNYTGIAQVTAAIAEQMLKDTSREVGFFFGRAIVEREIVLDLLERRNGELIEWYLQRSEPRAAPLDLTAHNIAIFPNRKTCRRGFDFEVQIIHDLSTLLTPQFHNKDTIDYHALTMLEDVQTNDLTFCVSNATRDDVLHYLGPIDPARVVTTPLAASIAPEQIGCLAPYDVEPYFLVLGTIEPRKNIGQVLRFLQSHRSLLATHRFVFLGRYGWGEKIETLVQHFGLAEEFAAKRILFPGFVSESTKILLLERAKMLIYPSLFEGFGLPVLEALSLGTPAVVTRSSSLPEVGGDLCYYFDPFKPKDFARAFTLALLEQSSKAAACQAWVETFSWTDTYQRMTSSVEAYLPWELANAR